MKSLFLSKAVLGMALLLPICIKAQNSGPVIVPDSRYPTHPGYEARTQPYILQEVQCLQNTTQALYQAYYAYCKRLKVSAVTPDGQLLRAMIDLQQDVTRLATLVRSHCSNPNQYLGSTYRAFHLAEYASQDSQLMAAQAGYVRSMSPYFRDIDQHLDQLGRLGYRNPMLRNTGTQWGAYQGRPSGVPERSFSLPPVSSIQPQPTIPPPTAPRSSRDRDHDRDEKVDIGDVLKQLFKDRFK